MKKVSVFKNFTKVVEQKRFDIVIKAIQDGMYKDKIHAIREAVEKGAESRKNQLKKQLPAFTISGCFKGGRTMKTLVEYNPVIVLDIDQLDPAKLGKVIKSARTLPFTYAGFVSPGGRGYKIFVRTNSTIETHTAIFKRVVEFYEKQLGVAVDQSGKDITRLCFMSWDEDAFVNMNSEIFSLGKPDVESKPWRDQLEQCYDYTQQKSSTKKGNRNNFVYLYASNANRLGIPKSNVTRFLNEQSFSISNQELKSAIDSAYKHHPMESGKKELFRMGNKKRVEESDNELLLKTPIISEDVYQRLPDLLQEGCSAFANHRQRDVFLTGALTIISGCLPNVEGLYNGNVNYPNLYSFIIAPAASGKGGLRYAMQLGNAYHKHLVQLSKDHLAEYEHELFEYQQSLLDFKKKRRPNLPTEPEKPPFRRLYLPANSSASMVITHLNESGGSGIICETEADTLGNTLKQDWGGYSDILRKAFHFERISYSRKTNMEYLEIEEPRLSVALSGTPGQILTLIPSTEDGLFSRFLFYVFKVQPNWYDVSPEGQVHNLRDYMQKLSERMLEQALYLAANPTKVELTKDQWSLLNNTFSVMLRESNAFVGSTADSIVKRLGVTLHRVVMIFTALRKFENKSKAAISICKDDDFRIAMKLVELYYRHAIILLEQLPKNKQTPFNDLPNQRRVFFEALPKTFQRKDALDYGLSLGIATRSIDRYLKKFIQLKFLKQPQYGVYEKVG